MNPRLEKAKKRLPAGGLFFALFLSLLAVGALLLAAADAPREAILLEDAARAWKPVGMDALDRDTVLALTDGERGLLLRLDKDGKELARREVDFAPGWAACTAGGLLLREDDPQGCVLAKLDPATLEDQSQTALPVLPKNLVLFDAAADRAAWTVSSARDTVVLWENETASSIPLGAAAACLTVEGSGLAGADSSVTVLENPPRTVALPQPAAGFLPGGGILTGDGGVYRLTETGPALSFRWEEPFYGRLFCGPDGENGLILSKAGGEILRLAPNGAVAGRCSVAGELLAVCAAGALVRKDTALVWAPLDFQQPEASPSPSVSPSASPSPLPAVTEGSWILLEPGTTVARVRELFRPEAVNLRDSAGLPVTQGNAATGMTANAYTLVVRGDCDGTGSVSSGDLREAARLLQDQTAPGTAAYRALDLNNDGVADGEDLLLLRDLLKD